MTNDPQFWVQDVKTKRNTRGDCILDIIPSLGWESRHYISYIIKCKIIAAPFVYAQEIMVPRKLAGFVGFPSFKSAILHQSLLKPGLRDHGITRTHGDCTGHRYLS